MVFKKSLFKPNPLGVRSLYLAYTLYNRVPTRRRDAANLINQLSDNFIWCNHQHLAIFI